MAPTMKRKAFDVFEDAKGGPPRPNKATKLTSNKALFDKTNLHKRKKPSTTIQHAQGYGEIAKTGSYLSQSIDLDSNHNNALRALSNRIGATIHSRSQLLLILANLDWNLNKAEAFFWFARSEVRKQLASLKKEQKEDFHDDDSSEISDNELSLSNAEVDGPQRPGGKTLEEHIREFSFNYSEIAIELKTVRNYDVILGISPHLERRHAVLVFRDMVDDAHSILLSRSEAALALCHAKFDVEEALKSYEDPSNIRLTLSKSFDHLREDPASMNLTETQKRSEKDERLAQILTLTGFSSWYSAEMHLAKHKYNLVKAMAAWVKDGIYPLKHKQDKEKARMFGHGRRKDFDGNFVPLPAKKECCDPIEGDEDDTWAKEPQRFADQPIESTTQQSLTSGTTAKLSTKTKSSSKAPVKDKKGQEYKPREGGVINYDIEPATQGVPDWTKFRFEKIQKGKYIWGPWKAGKFRVPDFGPRSNNDTRTEFDWKNPKHLVNLRRWYVQKSGRTTQRNLRDAGAKLSIAELKYLKELVEGTFHRHCLTHPDLDEDEAKQLFKISKAETTIWEKPWKAKFADRRKRSGANLYQLVKKWKKLCAEFNLKFEVSRSSTCEDQENWPWEVNALDEDENGDGAGGTDEDMDEEVTIEETDLDDDGDSD